MVSRRKKSFVKAKESKVQSTQTIYTSSQLTNLILYNLDCEQDNYLPVTAVVITQSLCCTYCHPHPQ